MALNYRYEGKDDTTKWTKADWKTYNTLVWFTLAVDIGNITNSSIEEFCYRVNKQELCQNGNDGKSVELTSEMIEKFIGLQTNVYTLSRREWIDKHKIEGASIPYPSEGVSSRWARSVDRQKV